MNGGVSRYDRIMARKCPGCENAVNRDESGWGYRCDDDDVLALSSWLRLLSPSSKITISSTQKTARARATVPASCVRSSSLRLLLWIIEAGSATVRVWERGVVGV